MHIVYDYISNISHETLMKFRRLIAIAYTVCLLANSTVYGNLSKQKDSHNHNMAK